MQSRHVQKSRTLQRKAARQIKYMPSEEWVVDLEVEQAMSRVRLAEAKTRILRGAL